MLYMMRYDSPIGPLLHVEKEGALAGVLSRLPAEGSIGAGERVCGYKSAGTDKGMA